jgi:hypothetical protein
MLDMIPLVESLSKQTLTQFKQINLQKSGLASGNLAKSMINWSKLPLFVLMQEPAVQKGGSISGLPKGTQVFAGKTPRAAIAATRDLNAWAMDDFTTNDIAACLWLTGQEEVPEIIIMSIYFDINKEVISCDVTRLLDYAELKQLPVILGADSNAHSKLWGCEQNNARGNDFEEILSRWNLSINNIGLVPTFQTVRASSIIDVTLTSYTLFDRILGWEVSEKNFDSDHKCVQFELNLTQPELQQVMNQLRPIGKNLRKVSKLEGRGGNHPPNGRIRHWMTNSNYSTQILILCYNSPHLYSHRSVGLGRTVGGRTPLRLVDGTVKTLIESGQSPS